ncbi:unnamed protein product, partial [Protopolystoma xenopodis]
MRRLCLQEPEVAYLVMFAPDLRQLSLQGNRIRALPGAMWQSASLRILDVSHNMLSHLPLSRPLHWMMPGEPISPDGNIRAGLASTYLRLERRVADAAGGKAVGFCNNRQCHCQFSCRRASQRSTTAHMKSSPISPSVPHSSLASIRKSSDLVTPHLQVDWLEAAFIKLLYWFQISSPETSGDEDDSMADNSSTRACLRTHLKQRSSVSGSRMSIPSLEAAGPVPFAVDKRRQLQQQPTSESSRRNCAGYKRQDSSYSAAGASEVEVDNTKVEPDCHISGPGRESAKSQSIGWTCRCVAMAIVYLNWTRSTRVFVNALTPQSAFPGRNYRLPKRIIR